MRRLLPLLLLATGCRSSGQENLGLSSQTSAVDVAKLAQPEELARALALSGSELDARLGAHRMDASSTLKLELPTHETQTLEETFGVAADGKGGVALVHDNSRDNGFAAVASGGDLYVKPRYGRFTRSRIEGDELSRLRATAETPAASYVRLLQPWLQIREAGAASVAGHSGIKLALSARTSPAALPSESEAGRKWRQTVQVRYVDGDVVLDAKTGAPLQVRLEASYGFVRDGKPLQASLKFRQSTSAGSPSIGAPADWTELGRARPLLDKQQLLEGLK